MKGLEVSSRDDVRTYTVEEERQLTENLRGMLTGVHGGAHSTRPLGVALAQDLHRSLFASVRSHAGRIRERGFGSEVLDFGPHTSERRDKVPKALAELFKNAERRASDLARATTKDAAWVKTALGLAAEMHARLIRIHPFEDGNGRVGRAVMNVLLVRLGLKPIPIEAAKQEYYLVMNHFHAQRDAQPLVDLLLRLYPS